MNLLNDNVTIKISKKSYEEILFDLDNLITMRETEGFDCKDVYGLMKYLIAIAKKQIGIKYKHSKYGLIRYDSSTIN